MRGHACESSIVVLLSIVVAYGSSLAGEAPSADATSNVAADLIVKDLVGVPDKELRLLTVQYLPGGASLPHRHNAQVVAYVLEGSVIMQVSGSPAVTLGPGGVFYEAPDDVHAVAANASATQPAKILVFMVRNKHAPISIPVLPGSGTAANGKELQP